MQLPNLKGPKLLPGMITSSILFERCFCGCLVSSLTEVVIE